MPRPTSSPETMLHNRLAFRIAEYFELPIEAVFSRTPFPPMSAQLDARPR